MEWLGVADESVKVNLKERLEVGIVRTNGLELRGHAWLDRCYILIVELRDSS